MAKEDRGHVFYYQDELNDDFEKTKTLKRIDLPKDYKYIHKNIFFRIYAFILFWFVAKPVLHTILFFSGLRVKGRKNIKDVKTVDGFFHKSKRTNWVKIEHKGDIIDEQALESENDKRK